MNKPNQPPAPHKPESPLMNELMGLIKQTHEDRLFLIQLESDAKEHQSNFFTEILKTK